MNNRFSIRDVANNLPRLTIDSAGHLGLGITGPSGHLHIAESTSGSANMRITNSTTGAGTSSGLRLSLEADENTTIMNHSNTNLNLGVNGSNVISIKGTSVGVGTTAPGTATKLQVAGRGLFTGGTHDPGDGTPKGLSLTFESDVGVIRALKTAVTSYDISMQPTAGNVGIGTIAPATLTEIAGSGTPTLTVRNTSASADAMIHIGEPNLTAYGLQVKWVGSTGRVYFDNRYNHATNPYMYFR